MSKIAMNRFEWLKAVMQADGLTVTAKNVASAIAVQFANAETGQINPSQETLANYLKVHRDTVKRVLRELRNAGWLMATGNGGRGKAPLMRLLTPGRIIPFRSKKGGTDCPAQAEKRGGELCAKGGQIAPSHYKEEQSLEQIGRLVTTERPCVLDQFMDVRFPDSATSGLRIVSIDEHGSLNMWSDWLTVQDLPKFHQLPIAQKAEKNGATFFYLPSKTPPTSPDAIAATRNYFETLQDSEAARYAAQ